jgi:hypothetical protein
VLVGRLDPFGKLLRLLICMRCNHDALLLEADIVANFFLERAPDSKAFDDHGHFTRVTQLLPHPSPVAAGLLAGDMPLLAQHDIIALPGEEPCR